MALNFLLEGEAIKKKKPSFAKTNNLQLNPYKEKK